MNVLNSLHLALIELEKAHDTNATPKLERVMAELKEVIKKEAADTRQARLN